MMLIPSFMLWRCVGRLARAISAWLLIGVAVGYIQRESVGCDAIAAVSCMLAGGIVYGLLGAAVGLLGGRGRDAITGGCVGGVVAVAMRVWEPVATGPPHAALAITVGALALATGRPLMASLFSVVARYARMVVNVEGW